MATTNTGSGSSGGTVRETVEAALSSILGVEVLGYGLLNNPEGFVLAVIFDWFVGFIQSIANQIAAQFVTTVGMFNDAVVGGVGYALGAPGRAIASLVRMLTVEMNRLAADLGTGLGPFAFVALPVVWVTAFFLLLVLVAGSWRLYKWIRNVVA